MTSYLQLDQTSLTLSRKTGIFDQRDKPKYVTCLAYASNGDVITGKNKTQLKVTYWGFSLQILIKLNWIIFSFRGLQWQCLYLGQRLQCSDQSDQEGPWWPHLLHLCSQGWLHHHWWRQRQPPGQVWYIVQKDRAWGSATRTSWVNQNCVTGIGWR